MNGWPPLRMRRDGDNGYHVFLWPIKPEDTISAGRVIFGIGLKNVFAILAAAP